MHTKTTKNSRLVRLGGMALLLVASQGVGRAARAQEDARQEDAQSKAPALLSQDGGGASDSLAETAEPPPASTNVQVETTTPAPENEIKDVLNAIQGQDLATLDLEALLENVVVTATKSEIKEDEAPAITTVVSREEIQRWGYQSVDEILRHVAGVYIVNDHIIPNVAVRGISGGLRSESGLVKVMIDGRSVAFRSTAGNWLGPELIPLSAVQQIEIIRGPASSLYGADAFLGVINVVTRRADQMQGGEIATTGNHAGGYAWGQDMAVGASTGDWQVLASLKTSSEDRSGLTLPTSSPSPRLPAYASGDLQAHDLTLSSTVALARATYALEKRGSASFTGYFSQIDRGAEFADWAQLTHGLDSSGRKNGTDISLRQGFLGLDLQLRLSSTVDIRANAHYFQGGPTARDRIEVGSDLYYVSRAFGYRGVDTGIEAAWRPSDSLSVLLGASVIHDDEKLPTVYDVLKSSVGTRPGEQAGDKILATGAAGQKDLSNLGANALVMWSPLTRVTFTGGLRYDHHNAYGGKVSGRLGGVATLLSNLHFKLLYGSAFKAPSPQLLYGTPLMSGDIAGNEKLKPSYIHTAEGQLSYRPNRYLLLTSGVAYSYLQDQAAFAQRGINQVALNISQVESISWESELRFDYKRKLAAHGNLTLNRTRLRLSEENYAADVSNYGNAAYPQVMANTGVSAEIPKVLLRVSAELSYVGTRRSSSANTLEAGRWYALDSYVLLGGNIRTVGLHLLGQKETVVMVVVRNLSNVRYADPGFAGIDYPQLGRTVLLQASQEF